jgi:type I restriction enzyme, S subunit
MSWATITNFEAAPFEIIDGDRGKNYPKQNEFSDSGYCLFLSATNVTRSGFEFSKCQFITEQKDEVLRKGKLQRDDVVLTTRGTIGNVAHFNASVNYEHMRLNSGMVIIRCNGEKIHPTYLYHFLRSPSFHGQVNSLKSGVAQPQLPIRDMRRIKMPLPPLPKQQTIAAILSAYDDLIENNRRRIQLLEQAARLLYKEWFVHLRFPGYEHAKIIDDVPEGWEKGCVGNLADVKSGYAFKSKDWQQEGNPIIKIKNLIGDGNVDIYNCDCVSDNVAGNASKYTIAEGTLLIAMTGATVGKVGIMPKNLRNFFLNQRVGQFTSKCHGSIETFLFPFFQGGFAQTQVHNLAGGAAQPNISGSQIESIELLIPEKKILAFYLDSTKGIFCQRQNLLKQNEKLTQARDLLLPRLMNGEVAV